MRKSSHFYSLARLMASYHYLDIQNPTQIHNPTPVELRCRRLGTPAPVPSSHPRVSIIRARRTRNASSSIPRTAVKKKSNISQPMQTRFETLRSPSPCEEGPRLNLPALSPCERGLLQPHSINDGQGPLGALPSLPGGQDTGLLAL